MATSVMPTFQTWWLAIPLWCFTVWAIWRWYHTPEGEVGREQWVEMEKRFQAFTDKMPKPTPGVPWRGPNPHPQASPLSPRGYGWHLEGGSVVHRSELEGLCRDAGTMLLSSTVALQTRVPLAVKNQREPLARWLALLSAAGETDSLGFIKFVSDVSARVCRKCASEII